MFVISRPIAITFFVAILAISSLAQSTEFNYQGSMKDGANPANGNYDFEFRLFDAVSGGNQIGLTIVARNNVAVTNGIFSVAIDFGTVIVPVIPGADRYLDIRVRLTGGGAFTPLSPRNKIATSPFAIQSLNAANATTAGNVTGVVQIANGGTGSATKNFVDLTTNQTNIAGNKTFTGVLSGNGSGLTNVSAAVADGSITTSKLADGAVTEDKLASELINSPQRNLALLGSLRWDLLRSQADFAAGSGPRGLAFDGANIWVTNQASNNVTKLRASDGANLGTFAVGTGPIGIAFDGANVWVMNGSSSNLTKLRASDGANLGTFPASNGFDVVFDGANIWLAAFSNPPNPSMIFKFRASDGANLGSFAAGVGARGLAFDGANIWVTNQFDGLVRRLRASDGSLVGTSIPVGTGPLAIAFDGASVWVVNGTSNNVTKLRASDGASQGTFAVGSSPRGIAFDGINIWVTNSTGIVKLRASDGTSLGTISIAGPQGIAFDGNNMWVTGASDVRRLPPAFP